MKKEARKRNGLLLISLLVGLTTFLVQCAPIGKPMKWNPASKATITAQDKAEDDAKNTPSQNEQTDPKDRPFFNGERKIENLKKYELPKEILSQIQDPILNPPDTQKKNQLVIKKPVMNVSIDKKSMEVELEVEVGDDVKEKLVVEGSFNPDDPVWSSDLFPKDEKIASEKRIQAVAACLDANMCKNIAITVYYKYKNEILKAHVESNENFVTELKLSEEDDDHSSHSDSSENKAENNNGLDLPADHSIQKAEPIQTPTAPQVDPTDPGKQLPQEPKQAPSLESQIPQLEAPPEVTTKDWAQINPPAQSMNPGESEADYLKRQPSQPKTEPKKEEPSKKIEIPQAPPLTTEDYVKREKDISVALPTPLPAPKTTDPRSIPGLANNRFIPTVDEDCRTSKKVKCQSIRKHDGGTLQSGAEFPAMAPSIMRQNMAPTFHHSWGNDLLVKAILSATEELNKKYPSRKAMHVLRISKQTGGKIYGKSHQNGLDADISWPGKNLGDNTPPAKEEYDRTFDFMKSLVCAERSHIRLFFVDQSIKRNLCLYAKEKFPDAMKNPQSCEYRTLKAMMHEAGHVNHFHIRSSCPRYDKCAPDDSRPECIHAFCQDAWILPSNNNNNIGC